MAERATAAPTCTLIQRTLDHSGLGVFRNCRSDTLVMSSWTSVCAHVIVVSDRYSDIGMQVCHGQVIVVALDIKALPQEQN
jgi:hypothetical protein